MLAEAVLPNFSQFTKELENWYFWVPLTLIFCPVARTIFKLPVFKKRNVHKCLSNKFVPVWVLGILFSSLNEGKNGKNSLGILTQVLTGV